MECREWKERLSGYIDGEIPPGETREVEEHLAGCPACRDLERRMRALSAGLGKTDIDPSPRMREELFARMESEGLLRKPRNLFVYSLRWAAIPVLAAAGLAIFLLSPSNRLESPRVAEVQAPKAVQPGQPEPSPLPSSAVASRESPVPSAAPGGVERNVEFTPEERDIVANLEILEDPSVLEDNGEIDEIGVFAPADGEKG